MLTDAAALTDLVAILAPGFIILMFQEAYRVGVKPDLQSRLFAYAVASTAYFAAIAPIVRMAADAIDLTPHWVQVLEYGVAPALLGILVALFRTQRWLDGVSRKLRLPPIHHIPTAWDWVFLQREPGAFVIAMLNNGERYAGPWNNKCFASSSGSERDLYLHEVWDAKADEDWICFEPRRGILICGRDIKSIEFFHPGGSNGQQTKITQGA